MPEINISLIERYNDKLAPIYDERTIGPHKWEAPSFVAGELRPHAQPGWNILDLGVGTGQASAPFLRNGCHITGIDISTKMLEVARERLPGAELIHANLENGLPPSAKVHRYNAVIAVGVIEFIKHLSLLLQDVSSVLEADGMLALTYEELLVDSELQRWEEAELGRGILEPIPELLSFPIFRYTPKQMEGLLDRAGMISLHENHFEAYLKTIPGRSVKASVIYGAVLAQKK